MKPYFVAMANATPTNWGSDVEPPTTHAAENLAGLDVYVDLEGLIDVEAERQKLLQEQNKVQGMIAGMEKKLSNANFVERAPAEVVEKARQSLAQAREQLAAIQETLAKLGK